MKILSFALFLMSSVAFVLGGCSDNSTLPVSPPDQPAGVPGPLAKSTEAQFAGLMWQALGDPEFVVDPGVIKYPDGKTTFKGVRQKVVCAATSPLGPTDLMSGTAVVTLDGYANENGEGFFYGKLIVTPTNGGGGVWELTYHAKATFGLLPEPLPAPAPIRELFDDALGPLPHYGWTIPLKEQGPGKGGDLTGMHVFMENNIYCTPDFVLWTGAYTGYVKSH